MSFAENLKQIRKERGLTQEELAEIMDVSRQAVSKWEMSEGYPEVEKLLLLSNKLNISLDSLMGAEIAKAGSSDGAKVTGSIIITSPHEHVVATCYKVMSSQKMNGGKKAPQYSLFGVTGIGNYFWGEPTTFLGWYANAEQLSKEIAEIQNAITQGIPTYELKYSAKVERKWLRIVMVDELSEEIE